MLIIDILFIAIMYLAGQENIHCDISYTNILIWEVDDNLLREASLEAQKCIMNLLGLSKIESLQNELKCWEGLLIDFDYSTVLSCIESKLALVGSEDKLDGLEVTEVQVGKGKGKQRDSGKGDGLNAASRGWTDAQDPIPKASSAHVVCFLNFITIFSLRNLAGHCSFHLNWAAHICCRTPRCTWSGIPILCPAFYLYLPPGPQWALCQSSPLWKHWSMPKFLSLETLVQHEWHFYPGAPEV